MGEPRRFVMSHPIPLRADFNASGLRRLARDSKDASQARRRLALATIYAGGTRLEAAEIGGVPAQVEAMEKWGVPQKGSNDYLKTIKQPTLVVNGSNDVNIPTVTSFIMQQNMPNAQLIIYPDYNHGAHHMYPELFVEHATLFLNAVT